MGAETWQLQLGITYTTYLEQISDLRRGTGKRKRKKGILRRRSPLRLRLLPLVRHLQQLGHLGRRLVVGREDVVHVLLEAVLAVELPPLLDPARHLPVDVVDVAGGAVGAFEGSPGGEEGDALVFGGFELVGGGGGLVS